MRVSGEKNKNENYENHIRNLMHDMNFKRCMNQDPRKNENKPILDILRNLKSIFNNFNEPLIYDAVNSRHQSTRSLAIHFSFILNLNVFFVDLFSLKIFSSLFILFMPTSLFFFSQSENSLENNSEKWKSNHV